MDTQPGSSEPAEELPRFTTWRFVTFETVLIVAAYFAYFLVRWMTEGSPAQAMDNAREVIAFQEAIGMDWEGTMQRWIDGSQAMITLMNWIYIYGHWPVIAAVAGWLLIYHPQEYRVTRNAFLFSGGIGLIIFATYPVAPPRLMDLGLVDTVTEHSRAYRVLQPPALTNQYAALPSLHFGWNLLIGVMLVLVARAPAARVFGVVLPCLMFLAIVLTANHYVVDGILGAIVALIGLAMAFGVRRLPPLPAFSFQRVWRSLRA